MNILINPYRKVAGWQALIYGVVFMLLSAYASILSGTHFDGVLDVHFQNGSGFSTYFLEHMIVWAVLVVVLGLSALTLNKSRFRLLDLAGMTAFSRIPVTITAFLALALDAEKVNNYIKFEFLGIGEEVVLTNYDVGAFIVLLLLSVVFIIWSVTWLYQALKTLSNSSGLKLNVAFVLALLFSETVSKIIFWFVLN